MVVDTELTDVAVCRDYLDVYGLLAHGYPCKAHHMRWVKAATDPKIRRLLIICPPAGAKTEWMGVINSSWAIGNNPEIRIGYITHSDSLSTARSMAVRDRISEDAMYHAIFPGVRLNEKRGQAQERWFVMRKDKGPHPTFRACGFEGSITGNRFDLLIVDDMCTLENTRTEEQRDKIEEYFNQTLMTRLSPNGKVIVIMTRWHHDDLAGRLLKKGTWWLIHTPAVENGVSYWPKEWPMWALNEKLDELGSRAFEGQYQGRPTAEIGNILQWFPEYNRVPPLKFTMHRWDTAWSEKQSADYSAMVSIGLGEDNHMYVLSAWRDRLETHDLIEAIPAIADRENPTYVVLEHTGQAERAAEQVRKQTRWPVILEKAKVGMDKTARVNAAAPLFEGGKVLFPARFHSNYGPWVGQLISECKEFPRGKDDDMVDALVGGVLNIDERLGRGRPESWDVEWA